MPRTFGKMREQAIGKVRRYFLLRFRKAYVAQQEKKPTGRMQPVWQLL